MSPRSVSDPLVRETPILDAQDTVETAVRGVLDALLPCRRAPLHRRLTPLDGFSEPLPASNYG